MGRRFHIPKETSHGLAFSFGTVVGGKGAKSTTEPFVGGGAPKKKYFGTTPTN